MTFKWNITRPPFHGVSDGAEVTRAGIAVEFETGSIGEAYGIFNDNRSALAETFGLLLLNSASELAIAAGGTGEETTETQEGEAPKRRGRKPNSEKNQPDPSTAKAPDPVTIPGVEAPPTGVLAGKIVAVIEQKVATAIAAGDANAGQVFADWLATSGVTVKGANYAEAVDVVRFTQDEKLAGIAAALGITA